MCHVVAYHSTLARPPCPTSPEDDVLHVKRVLDDSGGWHSHSEDVLQVRKVRRLRNSLQVGEIAAGKEKTTEKNAPVRVPVIGHPSTHYLVESDSWYSRRRL